MKKRLSTPIRSRVAGSSPLATGAGAWVLVLGAVGPVGPVGVGHGAAQSIDPLQGLQTEPGPCPPDRFYPGFDPQRDELPAPRHGGRVIVHVEEMPASINYMIDNSAVTRRMLYELHEYLVQPDWETWEYRGRLAESWTVEDTLVLKGGRGDRNDNIAFGELTRTDAGWQVTPRSPRPAGTERTLVPYDSVERVERGTVFTFHLREGVQWQDGHPFDGRDVMFSFECYRNPDVDCDSKRFQFDQIAHAELVDDMTMRFFFDRQYFRTMATFENLTILPSHRYDLADPDNPDHASKGPPATAKAQALYVNKHPGNLKWVGLGPYRLTEWQTQYLEAERFEGYFDPENGGWVDTIRWRHIAKGDVAAQALLNGELDFSAGLSAEDYFSERMSSELFRKNFYKGFFYTPRMSYAAWNTAQPQLADARVRLALAMCFDWDEFIAGYYKGLAFRVGGLQYYGSPNYDKSIELVPFDLDRAEALLTEAGWYDRDGDGLIDKDGSPLEFEYLNVTGNRTSEVWAQRWQEGLRRIGAKMNIASREWASMFDRVESGEYEAAGLGVALDIEGDPEQTWHSRRADETGANYSKLKDPEVDLLIEAVQVELDPAKRATLFHALQARIYALQPYMFGVYVPNKFVMSKRIRNFQTFALDPGYSIRRWYVVDS